MLYCESLKSKTSHSSDFCQEVSLLFLTIIIISSLSQSGILCFKNQYSYLEMIQSCIIMMVTNYEDPLIHHTVNVEKERYINGGPGTLAVGIIIPRIIPIQAPYLPNIANDLSCLGDVSNL